MMRLFIVFLSIALSVPAGRSVAAGDANPSEVDIGQKIGHAEELFEQGHTAESRQICESVLRTLPNRRSAEFAHALNVMSKIYTSDGDYERAISSARRSADIYEQIRDARGEAHALNNRGIAELQNGSYSDAQQDLEKALILSETGNDLENQVQVLNNLGSAHYFRGSYSEAMLGYQKALSLVNMNASARWSGYWLQITKVNQAALLQRLGRYDGAFRIYRDVEVSSKALTNSDRAHLDANLGTLYRRLGDPYKALDAYVAAQKLYSKQHDADGEVAVLKNIGIAYALDLNDLLHAANIFRLALALAEKTHNRREEMQAHLYLGETFLQGQNLPLARGEFKRSEAVANELATPEEQWKSLYGIARVEASERDLEGAERDYRRAISFIEQTRSQLQLSALRSEFFADKRDAYDGLISILFKKNDVSEAFLFLEKSRARNFQDRMQANLESGARPLTLEQARARLGPATELLEYWTSGDQLGLIWSTHETSGLKLKHLTPEQQARIQAVIRNIPDSLQTSSSNEKESPLDPILMNAGAFSRGIHHLLIIPDAWLSSVPFELLRLDPDPGTLLIERYDVTYLPTAALLRRDVSHHHMYWPWTRELVAFGDPVVRTEQSENQIPNAGVGNLPYAAQEIQDISRLTRGTSRLFLQSADLKQTFLSGAANSAALLHVSTHAFADVERPEDSRLLFSPDGANSEPAYVFLSELYDLNLTHVNLATISACDSERGKIIPGEGIQAFSRALLGAGANSSVTALWRVDDQSTAEFMRQFYYFLQQDKPKAEALRLAKLKFLHSKSGLDNPSIWTAFVLNGDGLSPIPRVLSWTELGLAVAGVLAVFLLIFVLAASLWLRGSRHREQHPRAIVP